MKNIKYLNLFEIDIVNAFSLFDQIYASLLNKVKKFFRKNLAEHKLFNGSIYKLSLFTFNMSTIGSFVSIFSSY